ncbi:hypothetical protein GF327_06705 [Candidatus Woesearchaeota archaeon]|nr:hypothetical protein [Candidatus Woesearchaeota archaeon]
MKDSKPKQLMIINIILIQLLIGILLMVSLNLKNKNGPLYIFWLLLGLFIIISFILSQFNLSLEKMAISLIIVEIVLTSIVLFNRGGVVNLFNDELFESQYAKEITEHRFLDPSLGSGQSEAYYGYTPQLHIVLSFLSILLNIDPFDLANTIFPYLLRLVFVMASFLLLREILPQIKNNNRVLFLSSFLFLFSPRLFIMFVSRRLIGAIFSLLCIISFIKFLRTRKNQWLFSFILLLFGLIMSDRAHLILILIFFSGYIVFFLISELIIKQKIDMKKFVLIMIMVFFLILFGTFWYLGYASPIQDVDSNYLNDIFSFIKTKFSPGLIFEGDSSSPSEVHINRYYETVLAYLSQFIFLFLSFSGFFLILIKQKIRFRRFMLKDNFLVYFFLFGIISYIISGILKLTNFYFIPGTYMWFFSIPLSLFTAYTLVNFELLLKGININLVFNLLLIILFCIGGLFSVYTPRLLNRTEGEDNVLEYSESRNPYLIYSGKWLENNAHKNMAVLGDRTVFDIYSSLYDFDVSTDFYYGDFITSSPREKEVQLMADNFQIGTQPHTIKLTHIDFVVYNDLISKYPSFLLGSPIKKIQENSFNNVNYLNKVYSIQTISIFHNKNEM